MGRATWLELAPALLLSATPAFADVHDVHDVHLAATAPAGGGLTALEVRVDLPRGVVDAGGTTIPIGLGRDELPAEGEVVVESLDVGQGKHVVHVRVPSRRGPGAAAWEAVLAAGRSEPLFAGLTGLTSGDPGERTGKALSVVPNGPTSFVLVGDVREDLRICGQPATLLDPQALYPGPLAFRSATVQRLTAEQRDQAVRLLAKERGAAVDAPLAKLLVSTGSSVPDSRGQELTDGDPKTAWRELRPGAGQGEFVVMAAPKDVPIARLQFLTPAADPRASLVAPKTFYVVTPSTTFEITLPESAGSPPPAGGKAYEVTFPQPIEASCVAIVLGDAYTRGLAHPDVALAEVVAYSEFDAAGVSLDDVAARLSSDRGAAAAQVLERAGAGALAAVEKAYPSLDAHGKAFAVDVAASHDSCAEAAPLLAHGLCEAAGEAPRKAREKLERCPAAAPVLAARIRDDAASRTCLAPMLATLAPAFALAPLADAMAVSAETDRMSRAALRDAFGRALGAAPAGTLASFVGDVHRPALARLEIMRAAGDRIGEAVAPSEATLEELWAASPPMRVRYLALGPLAALGRAGDGAATARLIAAARDADWPVRARATELAAGLPGSAGALLAGTRDPEPRVREAALAALAASPSTDAVHAAAAALAGDKWSFVRARAVAVIDAGPSSEDANRALAGVLTDPSATVRGGALTALGRHRGGTWKEAIRARLEDPDEDVEVRAAAAAALGGVCDAGSADRLAQLARAIAIPGIDSDAQQIGLGALAGLAALHPRDLKQRLAPLLSPGVSASARGAAERALALPGSCQ
jgi:hypothetical protein